MLPPEITGDLRDRIDAGLLRIGARRESKRMPRPKPVECLEDAYDVYAGELSRAGYALTAALLTEFIPSWVYQWSRGWLRTTRPVSGVIGNMLEGWMRTDRPVQPIPPAEVERWVRNRLKGRIMHWQAEALVPEAEPDVEKVLTRVQAKYTKDAIAHEAGIKRSTFYRWQRAPGSVRPENATAIVSALQRLDRKLSQ